MPFSNFHWTCFDDVASLTIANFCAKTGSRFKNQHCQILVGDMAAMVIKITIQIVGQYDPAILNCQKEKKETEKKNSGWIIQNQLRCRHMKRSKSLQNRFYSRITSGSRGIVGRIISSNGGFVTFHFIFFMHHPYLYFYLIFNRM